MKNIVLTFVFLIMCQFNFANTTLDTLLDEARKHNSNHEYALAIKEYKNYLKSSNTENAGDICLEIANCYFKNKDKNNAIKYVKIAIVKYGLTENIFIYSDILDADFSKYALSVLYDNLSKMQEKYTASLR